MKSHRYHGEAATTLWSLNCLYTTCEILNTHLSSVRLHVFAGKGSESPPQLGQFSKTWLSNFKVRKNHVRITWKLPGCAGLLGLHQRAPRHPLLPGTVRYSAAPPPWVFPRQNTTPGCVYRSIKTEWAAPSGKGRDTNQVAPWHPDF